MLRSLYIENIAVARRLNIDFGENFTVITGRTGAGKSILIDSLLLLCGSKNGRELLRTGEVRANVSAVFCVAANEAARLEEFGCPPDENGELELSRTIGADGRSTAKINRRTVPLSALREITPMLLSIQTQNERSEFADRGTYVSLIDGFADNADNLAEYSAVYAEMSEIRAAITELKDSTAEKDLTLEILKQRIREIDSAKLTSDDEEDKLLKLRQKLREYGKSAKYTAVVSRALAFSEKGVDAASLIEKAESALSELGGILDEADELEEKLRNFRYEIVDIAERVRDSLDTEEYGNPEAKLDQVEKRLSLIEKLERKYGATIGEIRAKREETAHRLADLENSESRLAELEKKLADAEERAAATAAKLSEKRADAARELEKEITGYLKYLDMPKVRFRISLNRLRDAAGRNRFRQDGFDDVDFLISVNSGEELQSLGKVSSGGELSRITLAIKTALAAKNESGTLIFDEIDTGVSGGTSEKIGMMLKRLGVSAQVISVTHSPQIASLASHHLLIEKKEFDGRTESSVREITDDERTDEIARIIGGVSVTEKQIDAAREMLRLGAESVSLISQQQQTNIQE